MPEMKSHKVTEAHQAAMADLKAVIGQPPNLSAEEMLVLVSQLVGNLIALQDQRKFSVAQVMHLVEQNIEEGNRMAIWSLLGETKGSA